MGGAAKAFGSIGKKIKKIDPLRGGDVILEKAGLPTLTGEGDKNVLGMMSPQTGEAQANTQQAVVGTPTTDEARQAADQANVLRRRRGKASNMLTGGQGDTSTVNVGTKTLLG